jgi:hypothetical protein
MSKSLMFLLAAVALAGIGGYFRYENAQEARRQATAIVQLDQDPATAPQAANGAAAPTALKNFVAAHSGASVSYILKGSFDRAVAAATASAQSQIATSQVYADAQRACSGKSDSITQAKCNQNYLNSHLSNAAPPVPVAQPKQSDYTVTLRSPLWTADLAGALFLGAGAAILMALFTRRRRHY